MLEEMFRQKVFVEVPTEIVFRRKTNSFYAFQVNVITTSRNMQK